MATYAIGDLQGCYRTLCALLEKLKFDSSKDQLWFVGDLVNRGENSLACLRFVRDLGAGARVVLGNHDLHLLAISEGIRQPGKHDTLNEILKAPDRKDLLDWLRQQPLFWRDGSYVMVHAGLIPQWDLATIQILANEVELELQGSRYREILATMYGDSPKSWQGSLSNPQRWRFIINVMTRMRAIDDNGEIDLTFKGELTSMPNGISPWFARLNASLNQMTVICGHWSALGLHISRNIASIDTGCVWGRKLTALRLEDRTVTQMPSQELHHPSDWD